MQTERRKVLDMLAEGKISSADAERLLNKLSSSTSDDRQGADAGAATPSYLRVIMSPKEGDAKVNIRVPFGLLRTGIKLTTMLPGEVGEKLRASGFDLAHLSSLSSEELVEELQDLQVDLDSGDGGKVRVFCE